MTDIADAEQAPEPTRLSDVLERLRQMTMEVHAYVTDAARSVGLGSADLSCIGIVRQAERAGATVSAGHLGQRLGLSPAATTALLDRMTRHGLIVRERSEHDARVVLVRITDRARDLGREVFAALNTEFARVLTVDDATLEQLERMLAELVDATERARDTREAPAPTGHPRQPSDPQAR